MQSDFLIFTFVRLQIFKFIARVWSNCFASVYCFSCNFTLIFLNFCVSDLTKNPGDIFLSRFFFCAVILSLSTVMCATFSKCKLFSSGYAARL